jgi:hypothetical protein
MPFGDLGLSGRAWQEGRLKSAPFIPDTLWLPWEDRGDKTMAKKTLPLKLRLTSSCARDAGIKPGKPWTPVQRKKVSLCVSRKLRSK